MVLEPGHRAALRTLLNRCPGRRPGARHGGAEPPEGDEERPGTVGTSAMAPRRTTTTRARASPTTSRGARLTCLTGLGSTLGSTVRRHSRCTAAGGAAPGVGDRPGSAVTAVVATVLVLVAFGALGDRHRVASPPPIVATQDEIADYAVADRVAASARPSLVTVRRQEPTARSPWGSGVAIRSNRADDQRPSVGGATSLDVVTDDGQALSVKV